MKITQEFNNSTSDWQSLLDQQSWNVLIYGGAVSNKEDRCKKVLEQFSKLPDCIKIGINRKSKRHYDYQFHCNGSEIDCEGPLQFTQQLDQVLPEKPLNIVLDLTSMDLDIILNIVPCLIDKRVDNLFGLYLVPASYGKKPEDRLELLEIAQPRGYVTFHPSFSIRNSTTAHYLLLGFDKGRAEYFFKEKYDWDMQYIHAIIGDPPYFNNGVEIAESANPWIKHIPQKNVHRVDARYPDNIRQFFIDRFNTDSVFDVVPQGPKPMLLGFLLFYLSLKPADQMRIRILYDFPSPREGCTEGIAHGYWYNCNGLLNQNA